MSTQPITTIGATAARAEWSVGRWIGANVIALAAAWGFFALFGGTVEALGAEHDSVARDLSLLAAFVIGGSLFALLRQRALLRHVPRARRVAIAAVLGLSVGAVAGFAIGGPPFDFILGIFAMGTVGGAVEWRALRHHLRRPGVLAATGAAGWLAAGIAGVAPAFLLGDTIDAAFGGGVTGFVAILLMIGLVAGAVGGALEGLALRTRIDPR